MTPSPSPRPSPPSPFLPFYEEDTFTVPFPAGEKIITYSRPDLMISPGEFIPIPATYKMDHFSRYSVHYVIDKDVEVKIAWFYKADSDVSITERIDILPANAPDGAIFSGSVKGGFLHLMMMNAAPPGPPENDLISVYVSIFGHR